MTESLPIALSLGLAMGSFYYFKNKLYHMHDFSSDDYDRWQLGIEQHQVPRKYDIYGVGAALHHLQHPLKYHHPHTGYFGTHSRLSKSSLVDLIHAKVNSLTRRHQSMLPMIYKDNTQNFIVPSSEHKVVSVRAHSNWMGRRYQNAAHSYGHYI